MTETETSGAQLGVGAARLAASACASLAHAGVARGRRGRHDPGGCAQDRRGIWLPVCADVHALAARDEYRSSTSLRRPRRIANAPSPDSV